MLRVKKILYPTDFSSFSNQAYFHAVALAGQHRASLTVLYVWAPGQPEPGVPGDEAAQRRHWREQLEQIHPIDSGIPVHHILLDGDPATEIVRYARDSGMDLIVMGTHGRTGLERLLMGSVAEKVLRESPCSVLVVKLPRGLHATDPADVALAISPA